MGDFLRGVKVKNLPPAIARGVHNHLAVDRFTDSHTGLKQLKIHFSAERRRFAGIILDVVFDHYLTKHWKIYSQENIVDFIACCYQSFSDLHHMMPPLMREKVIWMVQHDLLNSYAELNGVANALDGISRRIRFENRLAGAIDEVIDLYELLEQGFLEFFVQLCEHVREIDVEGTADAGRETKSNDSAEITDNNSLYRQQFGRFYRTS